MIEGVKFAVGDKEYTLVFRTSAMKAYQRVSGETVLAAVQAAEKDAADIVRTSALFRAACLPAVTEEQADRMMDELGLLEAYRLIAEATSEAFKGMSDPNPKAPPTS
jgi:hypothetical protein